MRTVEDSGGRKGRSGVSNTVDAAVSLEALIDGLENRPVDSDVNNECETRIPQNGLSVLQFRSALPGVHRGEVEHVVVVRGIELENKLDRFKVKHR